MQLLLLRFPYIIQRDIMKLMNLYDVFALSTISKRSREFVKRFLKNQQVEIHIFIDKLISVNKQFLDHDDEMNLYLRLDYNPSLRTESQMWNFFDRESIEVQVREEGYTGGILRYWPKDLQLELVKYFCEIFPKNNGELSINGTNVTSFREKLNSIRSLEEYFRYEAFNLYNGGDEEPRDELVRTVLMESGENLDMSIMCHVSEGFNLDFENNPQLKFKKLSFYHASWVTKDQFIDMLGSCNQINLYGKEFGDKELSDIFKKWMTGVKVEQLLIGAVNHYNKESTHKIIGELPGAVAIRRADIFNTVLNKFISQEFAQDECFLIEQATGRKALVYTQTRGIILTTRFKLDENRDI